MVLLDPEFAGSGAIRPQVVGNQQVWNEAVFLHQLAHELQRGMLVAFGLDQHIEDLTFGVDGAPQIDQAGEGKSKPRTLHLGTSALTFAVQRGYLLRRVIR